MTTSKDTKAFTDNGEVIEGPRTFGEAERSAIAEWQMDELAARKKRREDREEQWDEVDRQVAMQPDKSLKLDINGQPLSGRQWFPELEMDNQATALEINTADARRFQFPRQKNWFGVHVNMTDDLLRKTDGIDIVSGTGNLPSELDQQDFNELVESFLVAEQSKYDFRGEWDRKFAEAIKYGTLVGSLQKVRRNIFLDTAHGTENIGHEFIAGFAHSLRHTYLDDTDHRAFRRGSRIGPVVLETYEQKIEDLYFIADNAETDPDKEDGGWFPDEIRRLREEDGRDVQLIEATGDIVVPQNGGGNFYLPNVVTTVAMHGKAKCLIRLRFQKTPFNPYYFQAYHYEDVDCPYGSSPLVKGTKLQKLSSLSANLLAASGIWNIFPAYRYDPADPWFAGRGGVPLEPGTGFPSVSSIEELQVGDPSAMLAVFQIMQNRYAELTGTQPARLGAQTVSHTTAFAKDAELARGQVRIVDFVESAQDNVFTQFLQKQYWMAKRFRGKKRFLMQKYGVYVEIGPEFLPDEVEFEVFGAGQPTAEASRMQAEQAALQQAIQIDLLQRQAGMTENLLDLGKIKEKLLDDAGIANPAEFVAAPDTGAPGGAVGGQQLPGIAAVGVGGS